jgi:multidrug efflux pump subunit AcrB
MFLPLSMAVALAMLASFILSNTFVPVFSNWILKDEIERDKSNRFASFKDRYLGTLDRIGGEKSLALFGFGAITVIIVIVITLLIGTEIFPKVDARQAVVRIRLPVGTRLERTEEATRRVLSLADSVSENTVDITSAFVGTQPPSFPVNLVHLWTSGPHEAVIRINLTKDTDVDIETFKERLREVVGKQLPAINISFEPGDLVEQVINLGSSNPVEVAITGRDLNQTKQVTEKLLLKLKALNYLRDVQIATPLEYPGIKVEIDRVKAGQLGLSVDDIGRSMVTATSSSRFTQPNYWLDKTTGTAYQVQVEYPQSRMNSTDEIETIPVSAKSEIFLRDVANWKPFVGPGEYDRLNQQRFITLTANIHQRDLGRAVSDVENAIASLGSLPNGTKMIIRGQAELLKQTITELQIGLMIAVVVIFLLIATNFQSFRLSFVTLSIVPAVIAGSFTLLLITGNTLNIQSYMGTIMAVGVAIANSVLFVTNAEQLRKEGSQSAYRISALNRLRPILMTSLAMIAGMIPMSLGLGEGGDQVAPLAIAVIGGLLFSLISTLLFLPLLYHRFEGVHKYVSRSLDPDDENSKHYNE